MTHTRPSPHRYRLHLSRHLVVWLALLFLGAGLGGCGVLDDLRALQNYRGQAPRPGINAAPDDGTGGGEDDLPPILDAGTTPGGSRDTDNGIPPRDSGWTPEDVHFEEPPVIYVVTPSSGPASGGSFVTVEGSRFTWDTQVWLGGVEVEWVDVVDSYTLYFRTPALEPGLYNLKLSTEAGTAMKAGAFRADAELSVTQVVPAVGPVSGGIPIEIHGSGFGEDTRFVFGSREATRVRIRSDQLAEVTLPPSDRLGSVDLWVFDSHLLRQESAFRYEALPRLGGFTPSVGSNGGGDSVVIVGEGISESCEIILGGTPVPVTRRLDGRLSITTPGGVPGWVSASLDCGERGADWLAEAFYYSTGGDLAVHAVHPLVAFADGGSLVTVSGVALEDVDTVLFGSEPGVILQADRWGVQVLTPESEAGEVEVQVIAGSDTATAPELFRFVSPVRVDEVSPRGGSADGGWTLVIEGQGLEVVEAIWVDSRRISVTHTAGGGIQATMPASAPGDADLLLEIADMRVDTGIDLGFYGERRYDRFFPTGGPVTGGTVVTVIGSGFGPDCQIWINDEPLSTSRLASGLLVARTVPTPRGAATVEVRGCGDDWLSPVPFIFSDPAILPGGVGGGGLDGEMIVTVIESGTNARIEGASVMVGLRESSPWVGLTNAAGQITFRDPNLRGPQTVTAYAAQRSAESVVNVDARQVTLVLNPLPTPPCDPLTDPDCRAPDPPPTGIIVGNLRGLNKFADPPPGAWLGAKIETTRSLPGYGNPSPGPGGTLYADGNFAITTRLGDMALVARCGWFLPRASGDPEFVTVRLGIVRGIFIREGDPAHRIDVDCDIPLDQRVTFKMRGGPDLVPRPSPSQIAMGAPTYPGVYEITSSFSFGAEGVLESLPVIQSTEQLFTTTGFPALEGPFESVVVSFVAGTYDHIYTIPYAQAFVDRVNRLDRVISFPEFLPVPVFTLPSLSSPAPFGGVVEWDYPASAPPPDFYHVYVMGQLQDYPRYSVFVPGYQRGLNLADYPGYRESVGAIPRPGEPGAYVSLYVRAVRLDDFDFDDFDRYILRGSSWRSFSLEYRTIFIPAP